MKLTDGLLARCLVLLGLLLCSGAATARTMAEMTQSGTLRLCVAGSSAGFYQTNGEALAQFLNLKPEVTHLNEWDQQFKNEAGLVQKEATYVAQLLANGSCDVFPNDLHVLDWRASKMELVSFYQSRKVVVAHRDLKSLGAVNDLKGLRAAVQKGTAYEFWLLEQNKTRFSSQPVTISLMPTAQAMAAVASKAADFTVIGAEASFKWVRGDLDKLDILFPVDDAVQVAWGIHPKAEGLRPRLEQFFKESARVGSVMDESWRKQYGISFMEYQVFDASFGSGQGGNIRQWLVWIVPVGAVTLAVLAVFMVWNRRMRREIVERKAAVVRSQEIADTLAANSQRNAEVTAILIDLQRVDSYVGLSDTVFVGIAQALGLGQASFYRSDNVLRQLVLCGAYAGPGAIQPDERINFGVGLAGQCALEKRSLRVNTPPGYFGIRSALATALPQAIVLVPILSTDTLMGVIELACLKEFGEEEQQLLDRLLPTVALCMEILDRNQHTTQLLAQTQALANEIQDAKQTLEIALTSAKMGTWKFYPAQGRLDADAATIRLYGLEGVEMDGTLGQWFTYVEPQDAQNLGAVMQHTMANHLPEYRTHFRVVKPNHDVAYIMSIGRFTYDEAGTAVLATGLVWDITDLKNAEAAAAVHHD